MTSAMMTGERIGVGHDPSRGAAYVESWVTVLEKDPREIRRAAGEAQRISDYLLHRVRMREAGRDETPEMKVPSRSSPAVERPAGRSPSVSSEPQPERILTRNFSPGR